MVWGKKKGVDDLIEKLKTNTTTDTLLILGNRTFTDAEAKPFAKALAENTSLKELLCGGHELSAESAKAFSDALAVNSTLKRLSFGGKNFGDSGACSLLGEWRNSGLETLDLSFKNLGTSTMSALSAALAYKGNSIRQLDLSRNKIDDRGMIELGKGIKLSPNLLHLDVSSNCFGEIGCKAVGESLAHFESRTMKNFTLVMDNNANIKSGGVAELTSVFASSANSLPGRMVSSLSIKGCEIGNKGLNYLFQAMLSESSPFYSILELKVGDNNITECNGVREILQSQNCSLQQLSLDFNSLGNAGVLNLSKALFETKSALVFLDISVNKMTEQESDENEIEMIMKNLINAECLKELRLLGNKFGDKGALSLMKQLHDDTILETVSLAAVGLTGEGCEEIMKLLRHNSGLRTLELGGNDVGEKGKQAINSVAAERPELDIAVDKGDKEQ